MICVRRLSRGDFSFIFFVKMFLIFFFVVLQNFVFFLLNKSRKKKKLNFLEIFVYIHRRIYDFIYIYIFKYFWLKIWTIILFCCWWISGGSPMTLKTAWILLISSAYTSFDPHPRNFFYFIFFFFIFFA